MKLNFWPFNRRASTKELEKHIEASKKEATVEHEKVIESLQVARGNAVKLVKVIERNGFTIEIARAMAGHK